MSDFGKEFWTKLGMSDPFASEAMIARVRDGMGKAPELIEATPPAILDTHDLDIPGPAGPLKARLYRPEHAHETGPLCVFFHGGGYVFGDLDSHDRVCRRLCAIANVRVLAIAYRLALGRPATNSERQRVVSYVRDFMTSKPEKDAWASVFQAIFASAEFRYVR